MMASRNFTTLFAMALSLVFGSLVNAQVYTDPTAPVEDRVDDLLQRMTLMEKIGQMIMDMENTPENAPNIGAYMVGAEGLGTAAVPGGSTPEEWRQRQNELQSLSNKNGIPLLIAGDAVHGQNIISGATIFPHNIGLGATRNPSLIREIAKATAIECITSGLDMAFAPTLAVARTMTWGRTYESYSQDTDTVRMLTSPFIEGLQGGSTPWNLIATAKHWIGDGGTTDGEDAGDVALSETDLVEIHGAPYLDAIAADTGSIMISFSSINGTQMHGNEYWVSDVLKGKMGFEGLALSDWEAYTRNPGDYDNQLRVAINAGLDMLMAPYQSYQILDSVSNSVNLGLIPESRIDDAVRRVLRVKFKSGLFERKAEPIDIDTYEPLGSSRHRAIARQAVRESLVLLKNEEDLLPLPKNANVFLAGKSADNMQNQCGGWTMSWQGTSTEDRHKIVGGTTIRQGFEAHASNSVTFNVNGTGADPDVHDVAVVVIGELPYAEYEGDREDLSLDAIDGETISNVKASGVPMILVIISGRPLIITNEIQDAAAVVAAWLPGTEGDGIAEVFFGDFNFTGKLSYSWPANMGQILNGFVGDKPNVLFALGHGLSYGTGISTSSPSPSPTEVESTQSPVSGSVSETASPSSMPSRSTPLPEDAETSSPTTSPTMTPTTEPEQQTTESPVTISPSVSSSSGQSLDIGIPTKPGTLMISDLTSTSIVFSWTASEDNVAVEAYDVYDGTRLVESTEVTSFSDDHLTPSTYHTYTVIARDASGNESPASDSLDIVTPILVDHFDDGDDQSQNDWGQWRSAFGGTEADGICTFETKVEGYTGLGARVVYVVDSGEWGFCNMYLDFDGGEHVDLTESDITGVMFKMQGSPGTSFYLQLGTSLAEFNWKYYKYRLEPDVEDWTTVMLRFDDFEADEAIPYTLSEARQFATSLVWENSNVGQGGWFAIDDVDFFTSASQPQESGGEATSDGSVVNGIVGYWMLIPIFSCFFL